LTSPHVYVKVDRDKASTLGISAEQIDNALYDAFGTRKISTIYTAPDDYDVILDVKREFQQTPDGLSQIYLRSASGALVPLDAFAEITRTTGPLAATHSGQLPSVTLSLNLAPGVALGDAVRQAEQADAEILPAALITGFQG